MSCHTSQIFELLFDSAEIAKFALEERIKKNGFSEEEIAELLS